MGGFLASKYLELESEWLQQKQMYVWFFLKNMKEYIDTKYGINSILFANGIDKPKSHVPEIIKEKYGFRKRWNNIDHWEELCRKRGFSI